MPVLFTLPFWLTFALIGLAVIAFCAMAMAFKPLSIARYDVFEAIVAVFFALAVDALTTALRIRDYEARVKYKLLSTRDAFSSIFNKRACKDAMVNYLQASAPRTRCAFLILDLDDFKRINDTAGHLGGDAILRRTGNMLQELFRSSDVIGRFGGDEGIHTLHLAHEEHADERTEDHDALKCEVDDAAALGKHAGERHDHERDGIDQCLLDEKAHACSPPSATGASASGSVMAGSGCRSGSPSDCAGSTG